MASMDSLDPDLDLLRDELERLIVAFLGMVGLAHDACRFATVLDQPVVDQLRGVR